MVKKNKIALFVDTSTTSTPVWKRIKKSTELTIAANPETEEYDFIADENPTTELKNYNPEIEQPLKMVEGEDDFEYFWGKFYGLPTGEDAKTQLLLVYVFDKTTVGSTDHYKAWKVDATIVFNELNAVDSELNFNLNFAGDIAEGYATVTDGVPTWEASLPSA